MEEEKELSFGEKLKEFREHTTFRRSAKHRTCLTQLEFAKKLGDLLHSFYSQDVIQNWESGTTVIRANDRRLLRGIITELHLHSGITTREQADELLSAGYYAVLSEEEAVGIDPSWRKKAAEEVPDSKAENTETLPIMSIYNIDFSTQYLAPAITLPASAPPLPSLIIGREEDLKELKDRLENSQKVKNNVQVLTAIKGWPGVGKTTIASALAHDPHLKAQFPDGVLWTSLGQEPNILSEMAAWGRALGTNEILNAKTVEEARNILAGLLRDKRRLLIIDDVWQAEHAYPFQVGGAGCATLVTTRLDEVANAISPVAKNVYRLKVLKDEDALKLLKELAPTVVEQYANECLVLVQDLEGLPLAIQVAGRLLNTEEDHGFSVVELIEQLKEGAKLLEAIAPADRTDLVTQTTPTIAALLQKSLDRLDNDTKDCYAYLGVFAPKPATFDLEAMKSVWQVADPKPTVKILVDRGLLEYVPELKRYQMHALLVMLAKTLLTDDETE